MVAGMAAVYCVQNYTGAHVMLHLVIGVTACFVVGYAASLLTGGLIDDRRDLTGLTILSLGEAVSA